MEEVVKEKVLGEAPNLFLERDVFDAEMDANPVDSKDDILLRKEKENISEKAEASYESTEEETGGEKEWNASTAEGKIIIKEIQICMSQMIEMILDKVEEQMNAVEERLLTVETKVNQCIADIRASRNEQTTQETEKAIAQIIEINNRLHQENQKLKDGMTDNMMKPLLLEMCGIGTELTKEIMRCQAKGKVEEAENLLEFRDMMVNTALEHIGIEVFEAAAGEEFDPSIHRLLKSIPTELQEEHRKIAEAMGQGYLWRKGNQESVLVPCKVNVYNCESK